MKPYLSVGGTPADQRIGLDHGDFHQRKAARTRWFFSREFGWVLETCAACSGSGVYDRGGSPACGACEGTGRVRTRGPKALARIQTP